MSSVTHRICACCSRRLTTDVVHYICEPCFVDVSQVEDDTDSDMSDAEDISDHHPGVGASGVLHRSSGVGSHLGLLRNERLVSENAVSPPEAKEDGKNDLPKKF